MGDIATLIDAITANAEELNLHPSLKDISHRNLVVQALGGSLEAALALHSAAIPEWKWLIRSSDERDVELNGCEPGDYLAHVMPPDWDDYDWDDERPKSFSVWLGDPARALVTAILSAMDAS